MVELTDDSREDLVVLSVRPPIQDGDEAAYLAALERLSAIERPFVLMTIFEGHLGLSRAADRTQALWFKRTRGTMERHCHALAMVREGDHAALTRTFGRLWGFPILSTREEAEARRFLADRIKVGP